MVECLRRAYFKDSFGESRMRNGVRVDPLKKRLCINRIHIRRELLIKIKLYVVMNHGNMITRNACHLHQNRRSRLHVLQFADEMGSRWSDWDLF